MSVGNALARTFAGAASGVGAGWKEKVAEDRKNALERVRQEFQMGLVATQHENALARDELNREHQKDMQGMTFDKFNQLTPEQQEKYKSFVTMGHKPSSLPANVQEWNHFQSLSPEDQEKYLAMKRTQQVVNVGDVPVVNSPVSGPRTLLPGTGDVVTDVAVQQQEQGETKTNQAVAEQEEKAKAASYRQAMDAYRTSLDSLAELESVMARDSFDGAVGMLDQWTASFGAGMGTDAGVTNKLVESWVNSNILSESSALAGVLSDTDIKMLRDTAPSTGDSPEVWRAYVDHKLKPSLRRAEVRLGIKPEQADPNEITLPNGVKVKKVN